METTIDSVVIEIESNANKSNQNLTSLINTLNNLQNKINPALEVLNNLNQKLLNLQNTVNNINFDNIKVNKLVEPMKKVNNEATTGKAKNIDNYTKKLQGLGKINIAAAGLGLLGISMFSLSDALQESTSYITNLHLLYNAMGENVDKAKDFINNFSTLLGQDPSKVMKYTSAFYSLTNGFGVANDQAYIMSKNLTQLSYDLAAYWGRDITDTMQAVKSGISGEIEPMRNLGVALDQATLQQTAYTLGINKSINAMTRAEKTQLLYYQMMTKTNNVQKTLANTMLEPAQQISILKQQFTQLARSIGNIFIPILTATLPYLQALTKYLNEIAQRIANLLGYKINTEGWGKATSSMVSGIGDIEDGANDATKALKEMLAPFDELNVIDFGKDTGKGLENIATGGDLGIPLYDYDATEGLSANLEDVKKKVQQIIPFIEAIGAAILVIKNNLGLLEGLGIWLIIDGARKTIESILDMIDNPSWENFSKILQGIGEIFTGGAFLTGLTSPVGIVLAVIGQVVSTIGKVIDYFDKLIKFIQDPSWETFGEFWKSAIKNMRTSWRFNNLANRYFWWWLG